MSILVTIHQHQSVSQSSRVTNSNKFTTRVAVFISPCHLELDVLTNERRGGGDGDQSEVRSPSETMTRNNRVQRHGSVLSDLAQITFWSHLRGHRESWALVPGCVMTPALSLTPHFSSKCSDITAPSHPLIQRPRQWHYNSIHSDQQQVETSPLLLVKNRMYNKNSNWVLHLWKV